MKHTIIALLFWATILSSDYFISDYFSLFHGFLFFIFLLFITFFFKSYKKIYLILLVLGTVHHLFFNYFHRYIQPTDISLFYLHMEETIDSFFSLPQLFLLTFVTLIVGLLFLKAISKIEIEHYTIKPLLKYPIFILLLLINLDSTMGIKLLLATSKISIKQSNSISKNEIPLYPKRETTLNIVLLIGESMKYDEYIEKKLKSQNFFYKKIYAGAINTDVSVPLLLNAKTNPLELSLNNETNLFKLAKKNHFETTFISIQSSKSLQYIEKYLQKKHINNYKIHNKEERKDKFDFLLLEQLKQMDFLTPDFIVLQQIGQHSPYKYFSGLKSPTPKENYQKSVDYSFELYAKIYQRLLATKEPFVFIYTSDHGEFTGEGGRYGHNIFEPTIYEVPLFIASNTLIPQGYKEINSHYHLSQYITYLLGYYQELNLSKKAIIINGTMLSREDGYITIKEQL